MTRYLLVVLVTSLVARAADESSLKSLPADLAKVFEELEATIATSEKSERPEDLARLPILKRTRETLRAEKLAERLERLARLDFEALRRRRPASPDAELPAEVKAAVEELSAAEATVNALIVGLAVDPRNPPPTDEESRARRRRLAVEALPNLAALAERQCHLLRLTTAPGKPPDNLPAMQQELIFETALLRARFSQEPRLQSFDEVLRIVRDDMRNLTKRLATQPADALTPRIQQEVLDTLKDMESACRVIGQATDLRVSAQLPSQPLPALLLPLARLREALDRERAALR